MSASPLASPRRDRSAILFADVHGYAQLMDRNEERTYERVSRSIRLMKSLIGDYGGRVMNVAGDGVLALFESAPEALRFAVTIQQELRNDAVWSPDDEPVAFRIGINLGEVLVDEEANVQGRSVNVAARIQALARPGGICISEAVKHALQDNPDVALRSLGRQTLKNITEPSRCSWSSGTRRRRPRSSSCRDTASWSRRQRRPRWPCCRLPTCPAIRAMCIFATASPATSSPISAAFATCW
jgi:class 3 adenylate cyclase